MHHWKMSLKLTSLAFYYWGVKNINENSMSLHKLSLLWMLHSESNYPVGCYDYVQEGHFYNVIYTLTHHDWHICTYMRRIVIVWQTVAKVYPLVWTHGVFERLLRKAILVNRAPIPSMECCNHFDRLTTKQESNRRFTINQSSNAECIFRNYLAGRTSNQRITTEHQASRQLWRTKRNVRFRCRQPQLSPCEFEVPFDG